MDKSIVSPFFMTHGVLLLRATIITSTTMHR